jgi:ubiquinone biosynthesis protein UbiJ
VRHFNFYSSHIKALAQKSSTDTAKVLYSDAAQLVSRASVGSAARPWQWNLQADIETAQKKVTLAQSLDRDATRTKAAQNTPSDPKKGILETLKSVFGL